MGGGKGPTRGRQEVAGSGVPAPGPPRPGGGTPRAEPVARWSLRAATAPRARRARPVAAPIPGAEGGR